MKTKKTLRIMYLMDYFIGPNGGTERQVVELITNLDRKRFDTYLTVFRNVPAAYGAEASFPFTIRILDIQKLAKATTVVRLLRLSRIIREERIDLVHIFFNDASLSAPLFCKLGGARVITSRRDMGFWYQKSNLAALRFSNHFVDRIVSNCEAVKDNVCKLENVSKNKIAVIYNGHDEARFLAPAMDQFRMKFQIGADDPIIGIVANISPVKRHYDLLAALKEIHTRQPNACLVLVGGGGDQEIADTMSRVREIGIENYVRFLGSVSDPVPIIKHFDVCVLCSESEGLSNTIIEYMGCGKPTVCSDVGGNPELIKHGHNGFLVPVGDVNALAECILKIIENPFLAARIGAAARDVFLAGTFSVKSMAESHMALYTEICNS